ncbi:MAG: sugar kinase [Jannaschia sp.]
MAPTLTGLGECMIEMSQAEGGLYRRSFAGDVVNTLWYARRDLAEDWAVRFHTGLGIDPSSAAMEAFLNDAEIGTGTVLRVPNRRPGLYMIHLDGAERSFEYWRDSSAARMLASDDTALDAAVAGNTMVYLSGITLAILPPHDADRLLSALAEARRAGSRIAFDPNIRPALWPDPDRMRDILTLGAARADIVLPSFDDEAAHFGDATPKATADRYDPDGDRIVVVKNGPGDVCLRAAGTTRHLDTPPVPAPVDTTGAGDSFNGAFLAAILLGRDVEDAVRAGQRRAAEVICHHGALI